MAALREAPRSARHLVNPALAWRPCASSFRRCASTDAGKPNAASPNAGSPNAGSSDASSSPAIPDIETDSGLMKPLPSREELPRSDPGRRSMKRRVHLPHERYQYHAPKYYRGPLHPVQPPHPSDPTSREFQPGPFNLPRLKHTMSTVAADLLTLTYNHVIPGTPDRPERVRLREWEGPSPYLVNRPTRGPRGAEVLLPLEPNLTFRNIPEIRAVHVNMYIPAAKQNYDHLRVARAILQIITGVRPQLTFTKTNVAQWHIVKGDKTGVKATVRGNQAYEFVDKLIHLVFPKIKEWRGIRGTTGDGSGNLGWGLEPTELMYFPEIEANYSMYPAKMVPGCHIKVETTAKSDRHARLLLQSLGLPFYGRLIN